MYANILFLLVQKNANSERDTLRHLHQYLHNTHEQEKKSNYPTYSHPIGRNKPCILEPVFGISKLSMKKLNKILFILKHLKFLPHF